jgi:hypothetical protein
MSNDLIRKRERILTVTIHGGACSIVLGLCLIIGLARRCDLSFDEILLWYFSILIFWGSVALVGTIAAIMGGTLQSSVRATMFGAILVAATAGIVTLAGGTAFGAVHQRLWLSVAAGAVGGLCAQVGAMLARSLPRTDDESTLVQFSLREMLLFFLLVAVLLGYVTSPV